jgi:hypothetical protein
VLVVWYRCNLHKHWYRTASCCPAEVGYVRIQKKIPAPRRSDQLLSEKQLPLAVLLCRRIGFFIICHVSNGYWRKLSFVMNKALDSDNYWQQGSRGWFQRWPKFWYWTRSIISTLNVLVCFRSTKCPAYQSDMIKSTNHNDPIYTMTRHVKMRFTKKDSTMH